jgi:DNA-binding IclR family transcriptional regulator
VRVAARIGGRAPLHCTANGKVLLAFQPNEVIEEALRAPRARYTENTIVDPAVLRSQLAEIRQAGYCIEREEFIADIRGIAAPVFDFNGTVIAAIAVVGPSARITEGQIEALVPLTLRTAESISRSLGHKPYKDA